MNLRSFSTLQIALGVSIAVHAGLLFVRLVDPESFNRVFQDSPLEVILVNTKTNEKSDNSKARLIAQTTLNGGGEADSGRATTPLPPSALTQAGDSAEDELKKVEALFEQQTQLMAQLKKEIAAVPLPDPRQTSLSPEALAQQEKRRYYIKLLAEIEKRINEQNAKPRSRYISPSTKEEGYAVYYDNFRRKVEAKGTENFPEMGGKKLYGQVVLTVTINFDGRVTETFVERSSGNTFLDRRAQTIAKAAGPFGKIPLQIQANLMRTGFNRLSFVSAYTFGQDDTLETKLTTR